MPNQNQTWVGIDLNDQNKINVYINPENNYFQIDNNKKEINKLTDKLILARPQLIIIKRAQGKEVNLTSQLSVDAFPLVIIHSDNAKRLILEADININSSNINAQDLAQLGKYIDSKTAKISNHLKKQLSSLSGLNHQLKDMITEDKLQLDKIGDTSKDSLQKHISWLEEQLLDNHQKLQSIIDEIEKQQEVNIKKIDYQNSENQAQSRQKSNKQTVTKNYRGQAYQVNKNQQQLTNQAIPTKKVTKYYRGQSYEVEVPDYVALAKIKQQQAQNSQYS